MHLTEILLGQISLSQGRYLHGKISKQTNSVALVREQTIPTERQPLVGEVSANV
jgi:hypothetical protein